MIVEGKGDLPSEVALNDLAQVLGITPQRIGVLVHEGVIPKNGRGNYPLVDAVQKYFRWRIEASERQNVSTSADKLRDQRAKDLAIRTAERERELIPLSEAVTAFEQLSGLFLESISGLPARITRNSRERQRIDAICDEERLRLSDRFGKRGKALETGSDDDEADEEADA